MANPFIWHELATSDVPGARAFYTAVIGWTAAAYDGDESYIRFNASDRGVAGLMERPADTAAAGSPLRWSGYIHVADVDAATAEVARDGGTIRMPPMDIPGVGRFSIVTDPQGAIFHLMTPLPRDVPPRLPMGTSGDISWNEHHSRDGESAFAFYAPRFGWEKGDAMDMGPMGIYRIFTIDGVPSGGMMNSPLPRPTWLYYINVEDIDAAQERVTANGGTVILGPNAIPGGFILNATDPQGIMFALVGPRTK